jgi:hypothetical protein
MPWGLFVQEAIKLFGGLAIVVAAFVWLARKIIEHYLNKSIDRHKQALSDQSARAIEAIRNDLRIVAIEHEVRFRKLHERQAEFVANLHAKLVKLFEQTRKYVHFFDAAGEGTKEDKLRSLYDTAAEFDELFYPNRLFVSEELGAKIDSFRTQVATITNKFTTSYKREQAGGDVDQSFWHEGIESLNENAKPLFDEIRHEFQILLGVSNPKISAQVS